MDSETTSSWQEDELSESFDEVDVISELEGRWYYFQDASDKLFEFLDEIAQEYCFGPKGTGLEYVGLKNAWNRSVKFKNAIKSRNIQNALEQLRAVETRLKDDSFGKREQSLEGKIETLLRAVQVITKQLNEFNQKLNDQPKEVLDKINKVDDEEEQNNHHLVNHHRQQLLLMEQLRKRLLLEIMLARRSLIRRFGCFGRFRNKKQDLAEDMVFESGETFADLFAIAEKLPKVNLRTKAGPKYPAPRPPANRDSQRVSQTRASRAAKVVAQAQETKKAQDLASSLQKRVQIFGCGFDVTQALEDIATNHSPYSSGPPRRRSVDEEFLTKEWAIYNLGKIYEANGQYQEAIKFYETFLKLDDLAMLDIKEIKQDVTFRMVKCIDKLGPMTELDIETYLKQATVSPPENQTIQAKAHLQLAKILKRRCQHVQARSHLEEGLKCIQHHDKSTTLLKREFTTVLELFNQNQTQF